MKLPKFVKKNLKAIAVVLIAIAVIFVLINRNSSQNQAKKVQTTRVVRGDLRETLTLSGSLAARDRAVLKFQTGGRLAYVGVHEGDYVRKGRLIASLDQREVRKNLQKQLNLYKKTRWDFEQLKDDNKDQVMTDAIKRVVDKSQFDLDNAVLDVELDSLAIEFSRLNSPISGVVTAVTTPVAGINVSPADAQFEIINPNTIYFIANADQTEVISLRSGIAGDLVLDAYPDKKIPATVDKIAFIPTSGETGTVYGVKFKIKTINNNSIYRIGMTGDVTFTTKTKNKTLYVPIQFITDRDGKKFVNVKVNNKLIQKPVTTGMETDNDIEITSGLHEGDVVYD